MLCLQEAMKRDTIDKVTHPNENPRSFLAGAYLHPSLISAYEMKDVEEGGAKVEGATPPSTSATPSAEHNAPTADATDAAPLLHASVQT